MIVYKVMDLPTERLEEYYEAIGKELEKRKQEEELKKRIQEEIDFYIMKMKDLIQEISDKGYEIRINDDPVFYDNEIEIF